MKNFLYCLGIMLMFLGFGSCSMMESFGLAKVIEARSNADIAEKRLELELTKRKCCDTLTETIEKEDDLNK